ncbi:MAG: hypothetical protein M3Y66_09245, partial [Actinomycetota bacterium]|nr:hypothetical protein [Actinomycetota bacterium]
MPPHPGAVAHRRRRLQLGRARGASLVVGALLCVAACGHTMPALAGWSSRPGLSSEAASASGSTTPRALRVVALGDSVTAGTNCGCTPFPELYARELSASRGARSTAVDFGVGGLDTDGLLAMLR